MGGGGKKGDEIVEGGGGKGARGMRGEERGKWGERKKEGKRVRIREKRGEMRLGGGE